MATIAVTASAAKARRSDYPLATSRFMWAHTLLGALFVAGVSVDLWAHNNIRPLFETFFTPWHGLLYGGFTIMAAVLFVTALRSYRAGQAWSRSLPEGYGLSLVGAGIFAAGGVFDLIWHTLFGIEADFDALVSPSHLLLLLGATLMVSGPIRAAGSGNSASRWSVALATLGTLTVMLPFFAFFVGPFAIRTATGPIGPRNAMQAMEVLSTLVYSGFVVGAFLLVLRSVRLPIGSGTLIVGGNAAIMALIRTLDLGSARELYWVVALIAGVLTDVLLAILRPSPARPLAMRVFATVLPIAILAPYFTAIAVFLPVTWSVHALFGSILLSSAVGGLLGVVATPPTDRPSVRDVARAG